MTRYAALLRGIMPANPNMSNEKLRLLFEGLGLRHVQTVLSSGNILFETSSQDVKGLETKIEKVLPARLGFTSTTIILSQKQLQDLVDHKPFGKIEDTPQSKLNVTFLKNPPKTRWIFPFKPENKSFTFVTLHDRALCSVIDLTFAKTPDLMTWLEKEFGKEITTRTWKTVHKILNKFQSST